MQRHTEIEKDSFQLMCKPSGTLDLKIQNIVARWPGSAHDSTVFNKSAVRGKFERIEMKKLVADSGYAQRNYMMT